MCARAGFSVDSGRCRRRGIDLLIVVASSPLFVCVIRVTLKMVLINCIDVQSPGVLMQGHYAHEGDNGHDGRKNS